ncbi:phospholipase D-like domain-containing protein [Chryseobacterium fluminis]|uniref:phospholipase D-like domain-containing protein n=1 Tax=Chryseobacterium fluminis TaxID=2983606 RepID=UPI00224D9786|nr:phospholipase D-like domain-containing protein [Chryseobacterium sp. MMS21-Ot14]UZT99338.1 phospholipase D-like domain-containing protein [Chryseobacterium sp. MMS21-Ot14]
MIQDSISNTDEILERIKSELKSARSEILIAMAWFTNHELYNIIREKLSENVKVSLILSDQPDNEKLDFDVLANQGLNYIRIKSVGYGMMNLKFCIIDRTTAISGSYNWSNNAKNNHGQVLVTNFPKTVHELTDSFFKIKDRAEKLNNGYSLEDIEREEQALGSSVGDEKSEAEIKPLNFQEQSLKDFKDVLDNIIATEVGSFDKSLLKDNAYQRASENQGDHQVLPQAMDSLYSNFINEIEVIAEKKTRLKNRIEEQLKVSIGNVEMKTQNEIDSLNYNLTADLRNMEGNIQQNEKNIEEKKQIVQSTDSIKIPFIQDKIDALLQKINELKVDFVKPPVNWPLTILLSFMTLMLVLYIFVFYSSVAYIFIFSKEDIMEALNKGVISEIPEVFNAHAITKIWNKGAGGILFLFLFVSIPLSLGLLKLIKPEKETNDFTEPCKLKDQIITFFNNHLGMILIFLVDCFIAYKVARNINDIEYLTNQTDKKSEFWEIVLSQNFLLVFTLGTLGIYLFGLVVNRLYSSYQKRTQTHHQEKTKFIVSKYEEEMLVHQMQINELKEENGRLNSETAALEKQNTALTKQLQELPIQINTKINNLKQLLLSFIEKVENLAHIYQSQVDNDKLPVSKTEMENRVNIFMEGWSKYLYKIYSVEKAEAKTTEAIRECENWLNMITIQKSFTTEFAQN